MATGKLYAKFFENAVGGSASGDNPIDFLSDTIKCALCTSTYTPSQTAHEWFSDITNEITGTGYTAGGVTLTTKTVGTSSLVVTLDADDETWSTASFTARYAIFYKSTGTASTSPLIGYVDMTSDQTVSAGTFTIQNSASGIVQFTAA